MKTKTLKFAGCFCGTRGLEIEMTQEQAASASHQGQCDADVAALVRDPDIAAQLDAFDPDDIRAALKEYGAWDDEELADDEQNRHRAIWSAANDIKERLSDVEPPVLALCQFLNCQPEDVTEERYDCYGMTVYSAEGGEYAVGTDAEADAAWDASLDNYIDECLMPEIKNETLKSYFDTDTWKADARMDGRGHSLASYDGDENEEMMDGETYYIFRIN